MSCIDPMDVMDVMDFVENVLCVDALPGILLVPNFTCLITCTYSCLYLRITP